MAEYTRLSPGESVDILHKKERRRRSYASLIVEAEKQKSTINILVWLISTNSHIMILVIYFSMFTPDRKGVQANQEHPNWDSWTALLHTVPQKPRSCIYYGGYSIRQKHMVW